MLSYCLLFLKLFCIARIFLTRPLCYSYRQSFMSAAGRADESVENAPLLELANHPAYKIYRHFPAVCTSHP